MKNKEFWKSVLRFLLQMLAAALTATGTVAGLDAHNHVGMDARSDLADNYSPAHAIVRTSWSLWS